MSTILRKSDDPALADKLLSVVRALRDGADLHSAARDAGLDRAATDQLLQAIERRLTAKNDKKRRPDAPIPKPRKRSGKTLRLSAVSDGASRGNPGKAACAVIISNENGEELLRRARSLGVTTNNVAEYEGVILALELSQTLGAGELELKLDSELVVKQLNGAYKVKHASLKPLFERACVLIRHFDHVVVTHVPRAETKEADKLANDELDGKGEA